MLECQSLRMKGDIFESEMKNAILLYTGPGDATKSTGASLKLKMSGVAFFRLKNLIYA